MSGTAILIASIVFWLAAWFANNRLSALELPDGWQKSLVNLLIPLLFGAALIALWEGVTKI